MSENREQTNQANDQSETYLGVPENFEKSGFATVEAFRGNCYGFLVRYLYSALGGETAQVPDILGVSQWDESIVFDTPKVGVLISNYALPSDFSNGWKWNSRPKTPAEYDSEIENMRTNPNPWDDPVSWLEQAKKRDMSQLEAFTTDELAFLNQIFGPELEKLRQFQIAFLSEVMDQVPGLSNFQQAIQLITDNAIRINRYKLTSVTPKLEQLRGAAIAKTYAFYSKNSQSMREYEQMLHSTMLGLQNVIEISAKKREQSSDIELLASVVKELLDSLVKSAITELLPSTSTFLLTEELARDIADQKASLSDFTLDKTISYVRTEVKINSKGEPYICLVDEEGNSVLLVVDESKGEKDLVDITRRTIENVTQQLLGHVNGICSKTSSESLGSQVSKRIFKCVLTAKMASVLGDILLALNDQNRSSEHCLYYATKIATEYRGRGSQILHQYFLESELTAENFARTVNEATAWGIIKNGSSFYYERARKLGFDCKKSPFNDLINKFGSDSFSLYEKDRSVLANTSKAELAILAQKNVFTLESQVPLESGFIELNSYNRKQNNPETQQQFQLPINQTGEISLTNAQNITTTANPELSLPMLDGCNVVSVVISTSGRSEHIDEVVVRYGGNHIIILPEWALNQTKLQLKVTYNQQENLEPTTDILVDEMARENLFFLANELNAAGFNHMAQEFRALVESTSTVYVQDIVEIIRQNSVYSHNSQSVFLDSHSILMSLGRFVDQKTGLFLCQCDSANELLAYCLEKVFADDSETDIFRVSGFQTHEIVADEPQNIDRSKAHAKVKAIAKGKTIFFDATPMSLENLLQTSNDAELMFASERLPQLKMFARNKKKQLIDFLEQKTKGKSINAATLSDKSAPIPKAINLLNQIIETGDQHVEQLIEFKIQLDRYVTIQMPSNVAEEFGLNYLAANLDIYVFLREIVESLLRFQTM